jgi:NADH-quinone oxidoreductase subunit G
VRAEMAQLGPWDGERNAFFMMDTDSDDDDQGGLRLATWKQSIDNGRMQDGDKYLHATARPPVALVTPADFDAHGPTVTLTGDRGSVTLPAEVADDLVDGVVWVPANSFGGGVLNDLASPGSTVTISGGNA